MSSSQLTLKLLVDKKEHRVVFAEASKDAVDFLFSILSLPLATVTNLVSKQHMVGSLGNLYSSVETLAEEYILPNQYKDNLLKPSLPNSNIPLLSIKYDPSHVKTFYTCKDRCSSSRYENNDYVSNVSHVDCPSCKKPMAKALTFVVPASTNIQCKAVTEGFVKGVTTYMVSDALEVSPLSTISSIELMNKLNVKDFSALEGKIVNLNMCKAMEVVRESLHSKTVLTNVFLRTISWKMDPKKSK